MHYSISAKERDFLIRTLTIRESEGYMNIVDHDILVKLRAKLMRGHK